MNIKKLGRALLFPKALIAVLLTPVSLALLLYSLVFFESNDVFSVLSYAFSAYILTVWCMRLPRLASWLKGVYRTNKYTVKWQNDSGLRMNVHLGFSFVWNAAYAVFQLVLGIYHASLWYYSLAAYYILLALMRSLLLRHSRSHSPGEQMREELVRYRICGVILLIMNLAVSVMIFYVVFRGRTVRHHEITTIALAAYTFFTFIKSIVKMIGSRKHNSPVFSAATGISLAAASVSMLTLEASMLATFGRSELTESDKRLFLFLGGIAVSLTVVLMAIYMIVKSVTEIKKLDAKE